MTRPARTSQRKTASSCEPVTPEIDEDTDPERENDRGQHAGNAVSRGTRRQDQAGDRREEDRGAQHVPVHAAHPPSPRSSRGSGRAAEPPGPAPHHLFNGAGTGHRSRRCARTGNSAWR